MMCPVCGLNELIGRQRTCSDSCRKKYSRLDKPTKAVLYPPTSSVSTVHTETAPEPSPVYSRAAIVTEDTKGAVRRLAGSKVEWVIPGKCRGGQCLNPDCWLVGPKQ
jgi:hypothetical protein